jgi:hypothetical protein
MGPEPLSAGMDGDAGRSGRSGALLRRPLEQQELEILSVLVAPGELGGGVAGEVVGLDVTGRWVRKLSTARTVWSPSRLWPAGTAMLSPSKISWPSW